MGKVEKQVISALENSEKPLSLVEIANQIGQPQKKVFKSLRKLFEKGEINVNHKTRQYMLTKEE